jgi:hypothetical protein
MNICGVGDHITQILEHSKVCVRSILRQEGKGSR